MIKVDIHVYIDDDSIKYIQRTMMFHMIVSNKIFIHLQ